MSHDRARLSALVDGELDHEARDRVLAHLAQCDECRAVVETERRVKALLSGMPEASPGGDFLARLNRLGDPNAEPVAPPPAARARRRISRRGRAGGPLMRSTPLDTSGSGGSQPLAGALAAGAATPFTAARRSGRPSMRHPLGGPPRPAAPRPFGHPDSRPDPRRHGRFGRRFTVGVAGAASLAGMALVTAFTIGGATAPTTADVKVVPPIERYTVQHADSAVDLPFADPGAATATIGDSNLTGLLSTNR